MKDNETGSTSLYDYSKPLFELFGAMVDEEVHHGSRVLDIGTGDYVPFLDLLAEKEAELVCIDIDKDGNVFGDTYQQKAAQFGDRIRKFSQDINDYVFDERDVERHPEISLQPFDVILLNCAIHELHEGLSIPEYFPRLFDKLYTWLKPDGFVLIGEQYYPSYLSGGEIDSIWKTQFGLTGHASPPEQFPHPDAILTYARWGSLRQSPSTTEVSVNADKLAAHFDVRDYAEIQLRHGRHYFAAKLIKRL